MSVFRENTPVKEDDICIILDSRNNGFDYPVHNHPEVEINLVMGMSGKRIVGDSTEQYFDQDLVILGPYLYHKWFGDEELLNKKQPYRVITIQFDLNQLSNKFFAKESFYMIRKLLKESSRGIQFRGEVLDQAANIMAEMTRSEGFDNAISFLKLLDLLSKTKGRRYLTSLNFNAKTTLSFNHRIQIAYSHIIQNYTNSDFKMSHVAKKVQMSESAFSHFFQKQAFRSFSDFLIDLRLSKACKLLIESDKSVSEICYQSGFNNLANFNRLFKKYRAMPPSKFRKKHLSNVHFEIDKQMTPWQFIPADVKMDQIIKPKEYSTRVVHF
jgi:AraC-like DNA-binding protein